MNFKKKLLQILKFLKTNFLNRKYTYSFILILVIVYLFCLPKNLFCDPLSTVITDSDNKLLGAKIADDGQWRFPYSEIVPEKFEKSIICFEDQHFYSHPGINPVSLFRAAVMDIRVGKIVSGGSTISMQVIRLSRKSKERTIKEKIIEIILATRLELRYSKKEILALYSSYAPFGGNVVGLEAASWRYFQRSSKDLSWAESATLAILPNAPSLIFPGKNKEKLLNKRNFLLEKLYKKGFIDSLSYKLSLLESIPDKPYPLPQNAYHLLMEVYNGSGNSKIIQTSVNNHLQSEVNEIVNNHYNKLKSNEIYNIAALVVEVESGKVLAYVGNVDYQDNTKHGNKVNIINAPRSSGSILKPVLYAAMINDGEILPGTLVPDIPVNMTGFTPQNFNLKYDGAVPAKKALSRSLNVPSVKLLKQYSLEKFYFLLQNLGITTLNYPSSHYGLTLILGGAEVTLWDITGVYASLSRTLNHYFTHDGMYNKNDIKPLTYYDNNEQITTKFTDDNGILDASSIWLTYNALLEVNRPSEETGWELFSGSRKIAWKTGTSFGFRDAWAVGTTPEYVVGVWVGNASGEGRPGLVGANAAAPVLFDIFNKLPATTWFQQPVDEMIQLPVCRQSGHRPGEFCADLDTIWVSRAGLRTEVCPYHQLIHLDSEEKYRVKSECYPPSKMVHKPWFVLPPVIEYYYKSTNPAYRSLPPFRDECVPEDQHIMDLIYPTQGLKVYVPIELDGNPGKVILEAVHKQNNTQIFWHLNEQYIGTTEQIHQMGISPKEGHYTLTLVDNQGNELTREFDVIGRN